MNKPRAKPGRKPGMKKATVEATPSMSETTIPNNDDLAAEIAAALAAKGQPDAEIAGLVEAERPEREAPAEPSVFEALAALDKEAPRAKVKKQAPATDLNARAHQMAMEAMAKEREQQQEAAKQRALGKRPKNAPPVQMAEKFSEYVLDDTGIDPALIKPDHLPRWVRTVDKHNKPDARLLRVRYFKHYGAEVIREKDGTPMVGPYGVAMQIPLEGKAAQIKHSAPRGMADIADLNAQVADEVEQANRGGHHLSVIGAGAQPDRSVG